MESTGGTLTIRTRVSLDRRLVGEDGRTLPTAVIEFTDTGPGMPESVVDQLATPFFTTRAGGSGLGLALSRHWTSRHGGTLRIESAPGRGTTVRVLLPLRRAA
jgi:signal transduction histidine kinase